MADKEFIDLPTANPLDGTEVLPIQKGGATVKVTVDVVAARAPIQDHNSLNNLAVGDTHSQYHTDARGDARYVRPTRIINTGNGISGGGDLSADRVLAVVAEPGEGLEVTVNGVKLNINTLGLLPESIDAANDLIALWNASESRMRVVNVSTALAGASGFVPTARQIVSGPGLTGGGDLSTDRTLAVGAGAGIVVNADDIQLDTSSPRNLDHSALAVTTGTGLTGGGDLTAPRSIALDTTNTRNIDHSVVSITGAQSVAGGGDITAARTLTLSGDAAAPGNNKVYGTNASGVKGWQDLNTAIRAVDGPTSGIDAQSLAGNFAADFATATHTHPAELTFLVKNLNYTFALTDAAAMISHTSGTGHTYTVPADGTVNFPFGTVLNVLNDFGGGALQIVPAVGVTLRKISDASFTGGITLVQMKHTSILKVGSNSWILFPTP